VETLPTVFSWELQRWCQVAPERAKQALLEILDSDQTSTDDTIINESDRYHTCPCFRGSYTGNSAFYGWRRMFPF
jgi:hypothetical protein